MTAPDLHTPCYEASEEELEHNTEAFAEGVCAGLESEFMIMPKGAGFIEYETFERGYLELKRLTANFTILDPDRLFLPCIRMPVMLIVLRSMLGLTPPEWAYLAAQRSDTDFPGGYIRSIDRKIRMAPFAPVITKKNPAAEKRITALLDTACRLLRRTVPQVGPDAVHRLDKIDTRNGLESLRPLAEEGVPYPALLYERFLGRPFAAHRDSVSELVGGGLETAVESILKAAGIGYKKAGRSEKIPGFDQAPDFFIPSEVNPTVVIEAKMTEDDGTARDKITRIQHLVKISREDVNTPRFEVVAVIGGRGFGVRREDMKKLILAVRGKVFTANDLDELITSTRLQELLP